MPGVITPQLPALLFLLIRWIFGWLLSSMALCDSTAMCLQPSGNLKLQLLFVFAFFLHDFSLNTYGLNMVPWPLVLL